MFKKIKIKSKKKMAKREIEIGEFPIHKMMNNFKLIEIGKPGSGKSEFVKDLMNVHKHKFPVVIAFSGSEENNSFYSKMMNNLYVYPEYSEEAMQNIEKRQKLAMRDPNLSNPNALLILDDVSDDKKFFNRPLYQRFIKNGRHWNLSQIQVLHDPMDIPSAIRSTIDYSVLYRDPIETNRKKLYENYASIIGAGVGHKQGYEDFCDIFDQCTEERFNALVIQNTRTESNRIEDCVFWYKARQYDDVKVGCQEYQQWANARYNSNYISEL